jgi:hypothetical protein
MIGLYPFYQCDYHHENRTPKNNGRTVHPIGKDWQENDDKQWYGWGMKKITQSQTSQND